MVDDGIFIPIPPKIRWPFFRCQSQMFSACPTLSPNSFFYRAQTQFLRKLQMPPSYKQHWALRLPIYYLLLLHYHSHARCKMQQPSPTSLHSRYTPILKYTTSVSLFAWLMMGSSFRKTKYLFLKRFPTSYKLELVLVMWFLICDPQLLIGTPDT
jgi:hypothetical protein